MSQWAAGQFNSADALQTSVANFSAVEKVKVYQELIELNFERYKEVMSYDFDAQEWSESSRARRALRTLRSRIESDDLSDSGSREGDGDDEGDEGDGATSGSQLLGR